MKFAISTILFTLTTLALAKEGIYLENPPATGGVEPIAARSLVAEADLAARGIASAHCPHEFGYCSS